MKVREIMNREVVALRPADSIREAARLLAKNASSALPVVNGDGSILGMLTDEDLLIRLKNRRRPFWQTLFVDEAELALEYRKAVGTKVKDVMCAAPAPVDPEASLESAAERLVGADSGMLPVLDDGKLVGTVSYGDLVKAVAETADQPDVSPTDDELVAEMKARVSREDWVSNRGIWIGAEDGVITLSGMINNDEEKASLSLMALTIPGCKGVENNLVSRSLLKGRALI